MIKKSLQFIPLFFIIISFLFFNVSFVDSQGSSDAIAIRVMPNPQHYTIERWYQEQGFQGSPQSLVVDGYQAIRDGRTVYVNASNINASEEKIHTNIYLISYNQESENSTVDILGQIVSHWKFNHNISATGKCSISTITCIDNDDCPGNYVCGNNSSDWEKNESNESNDWQKNKCVIPDQSENLDNTKTCLTDQDCPNNFFCTSKKSQIIRDVRRLGQITEMNNLLDQYKNNNGKFPTLNSGTYIPQMSISTWPSWQAEFLSEIGMTADAIDPVNSLGSCGDDFNLKTCWNGENQSFFDSNLQDGVDLPDNSLVYVYTADDNGVDYDLCANMESGYDVGDGGVSNNNCDFDIGYFGVADNEAPYLVDYNLEGVKSEPFRGMVRFEDPEGDSLTWSLSTSMFSNFNSWSAAPILKNTDNPNQKMIFAESAGNLGEYPITLKVRDDEGNETTEQLEIVIGGKNLKIQAEDVDYFIDVDNPLDYRAYIIGDNLPSKVIYLNSNLNVTYSGFGRSYRDNKDSNLSRYNDFRIAQKIDYPGMREPEIVPEQPEIKPEDPRWPDTGNDKNFNEGNFSTSQTNLGHGLTKTIKKIADNRYELRIHGLLGDTNGDGNINENLGLNDLDPNVINFNFSVSDTNGVRFNEKFKINVISEKPYLNMECQEVIRVNEMYSCQVVNENSNNENFFSYTSFPNNIDGNNSGLISGRALEVGEHNSVIVAENEYGVTDDILWNLKIDNYCGDGSVQDPNTEQQGGPNGDGREECDGINSIALTPKNSSIDKQYDCTTKLNDYYEKPVPQGTCTFDGGYCGDNIVQEVNFRDDNLEECDFGEDINCCNDCKWTKNYNDIQIYFQGEREEVVLANNAQTYIDFPQVRGFKPGSGRISIEAIPSNDDKTAIVYVTDTSGSMPNGMNEVKNALTDSIDSLRQENAEIHVGLVAFAAGVKSTTSIDNLSKDYHYNNLIDDINSYNDDGGTYTSNGISEANGMLSNYNAEHKYIILLADGDYNSGYDPSSEIDIAKDYGAKIFTITYGDADITEDMCFWSSNDECVCAETCASNNNSYVDFYAYVSEDATSVYNQITDQIIEMPTGSVHITLNDKTSSYSLDDTIVLENKQIDYNNVNCIQESATCDPNKIPISVSYDGDAVIKLYNLNLKVLKPCEVN